MVSPIVHALFHVCLLKHFNLKCNFRPKEFVPLASTEVCADGSSDDDDSSSGSDDLFVNTNRPQCVYESTDSSENELSDTNKNDDL